jgi:hypothetical protein
MDSIKSIFARRNVVDAEEVAAAEGDYYENKTMNMTIGILSIIFLGLVLATCLIYLRRTRQRRLARAGQLLPLYADVTTSAAQHQAASGAFTIHTTDKHGRSNLVVIGRDGQPMLANPSSPPNAKDNAPEIRITFPDEQTEHGTTKGRVVVVRMGETTVGLEPVKDEQLPAYEKENGAFVSIDMDHIGGLKEKDRSDYR